MGPSRWLPLATFAFILGACAPISVAPSGDVPPSPTATPAPIARVPAAELQRVVVDEVEVGPGPADGADAIGVTPGLLVRDDPVWVLDATGDDEWSLVVGGTTPDELALPFGWVPVELEGEPTLGATATECVKPPLSVAQLVALGRFGGLACYGDLPIAVIGFTPVLCGVGGSPRTGSPEWLNGTWSGFAIGNREPVAPDFQVDLFVTARVAPGLDFSSCGEPGWYRFTAHFDDPASATCVTEIGELAGVRTLEPRLTKLLCRTQLVVTDAMLVRKPAGG